MAVLNEIRDRIRQVAPQVLAACVVAYFVFHAIQGDRGLLAYLQLTQQLEETEVVAQDLADRRMAWEHKVSLLKPGSLDPDMLEERARSVLNYLRDDEVVIYLPEERTRTDAD
ncbi:FtsB family cell division protein [Fodinicurvata sediminis]|uniref:FtsB family cell division protein n=1 Tax=Fodinicurvata sediminis TaxID=1121832 RepID=UPI0003B54040|nr:septum formation initiator family protein [Fodinicurvata sediminis]